MVFGRVYSLRTHQTDDIYIGSTIQTLSQRMTDHRVDYKAFLNNKMNYISSYEILQYNDAYIELLFEGEFESKNAFKKKEGEFQRSMNCVNKNIAGRTLQEYRDEHKEQQLEYNTKYRDEHKEQQVEYNTKYKKEHQEQINENLRRKIKCECGSTICKGAKITHIKTK